jgi:hypothetical protein
MVLVDKVRAKSYPASPTNSGEGPVINKAAALNAARRTLVGATA